MASTEKKQSIECESQMNSLLNLTNLPIKSGNIIFDFRLPIFYFYQNMPEYPPALLGG